MLVFRAKLFDGVLKGTGNVYTHTADAELLGSVERVTLGMVFDGVTVDSGSASFTLQLENSPDGTRWMNQSGTPEYSATLPLVAGKCFVWATNFGSTTIPIGGYVRMRLALAGNNPAGYLRLWAIGRNPAF